MAYKKTGRVYEIGEKTDIASRYGAILHKQDLIIEGMIFDSMTGEPSVDEDNLIKFGLIGDRCDDLKGLRNGEIVTVHFDVRGRRYLRENQWRYMVDVRVFKVERHQTTKELLKKEAPAVAATIGRDPAATPPTLEEALKNAQQNDQETGELPF